MNLPFCKNLLHIRGSRVSNTHFSVVLQNPYLKFLSFISKPTKSSSLTVDYLINSCGLSPETAITAAKQILVDFKTTEKPDSVLRFLEANGFSKTHITKLISNRPRILCARVDKTLKPKIKQLQDLGFSGLKLVELIDSNPNILYGSFKSQILPSLKFIKGLVGTDQNVIKALKQSRWLLSGKPQVRMQPNIVLLQSYNVPNSRIAYLIINQSGCCLMKKKESLKEIVETVLNLGFKPESGMFSIAIRTICSMSKSIWNTKIKSLKDLGWSEEEIFRAFRKMPHFLSVSEKKIKQVIEFFAKMLKWNASVISNHPLILTFSLKERVIPRIAVYQMLKSKELVREESELFSMFYLSEKNFLKKYVTKYQGQFPDLLMAYKGGRLKDMTATLVVAK